MKVEFSEHTLGERAAFTIFNQLPLSSLKQTRLVSRNWRDFINQTIWPDNYHSIAEAFERTTRLHPNNRFIVYQGNSQTFQEVNSQANRIAAYLLSLNLPYEARIGVYLPNSPALFVVMLAIWKAGLVYFPLPKNDDVSQNRLLVCARECQPALLVTTESFLQDEVVVELTNKNALPLLKVDLQGGIVNENINQSLLSDQNPHVEVAPNQLAYIIYTSGSTGTPKGAMIEHKGLVKSISANSDVIALQENDRVMQLASISFDAHIMEFGMPFVNKTGAELHVMPRADNGRLPLEKIGRFCRENKTTVGILTPSILEVQQPADFETLRAIISTGEQLYEATIRKWAKNRIFINGFGYSEATIATSLGVHSPDDEAIHIGKAIGGLKTYLLKLPKDERGVEEKQLAIAGYGLGRGYLNKEVLTNDRFCWIKCPDDKKVEIRVYLTGDIARKNEAGNLEFICRRDDQLKVHGKLIRLEEIQVALNHFSSRFIPFVNVINKGRETGVPVIAAYLFKKDDKPIQFEMLWEYLTTHLTSAMFPSLWYTLPISDYATCVNSSNKLQSAQLAKLIKSKGIKPTYLSGYSEIAPRDDIEKQIASIWMEILNINPAYLMGVTKTLYIDSHFFHLGGTSLLCLMMLQRVADKYPALDPETVLNEFVVNPTLGALGRMIRRYQELRSGSLETAVVHLSGKYEVGKQLPPGVIPLWMPASLMGRPSEDYKVFVDSYKDKSRPIFGLKARGLTDALSAADSLTEIATNNLRDVYAMQDREPYLFLGWSGGGLVAYEMARLAQKQGKLAFVVMIDSESPTYLRSRDIKSFSDKYFFRLVQDGVMRAKLNLTDADIQLVKQSMAGAISNSEASKNELVNLFYRELKYSLLRAGKLTPASEYFIEYLRSFFIAALSYSVLPVMSGVSLVAAEASRKRLNDRLGWPDHCPMSILQVAGDHFSIMLNPELLLDYAELVQGLQREADVILCRQLQHTLLSTSTLLGEVDTFQLPEKTCQFVLRESMERERSKMQFNKSFILYYIAGPSGYGKTTFATYLVDDLRAKNTYDNIVWLNSRNGLRHEFNMFANHLKISTEGSFEEMLARLWRRLQNSRILLVLDDLQSADAIEVKSYLNPVDRPKTLHVFVTAKNCVLSCKEDDFGMVSLEVFHEKESINFFGLQLRDKPHLFNEADAKELCAEDMLAGHPLALTLAAARMCKEDMSISDFIKSFKAVTDCSVLLSEDKHKNAASKILQCILAKLKNSLPDSVLILQLCSLMNTTLIPKVFVRKTLDMEQRADFPGLIKELQQYALIQVQGGGNYYTMHPLIQECLRADMSDELRSSLIELAIKQLTAIFEDFSPASARLHRHLLPHVRYLKDQCLASYNGNVSSLLRFYEVLATYIVEVDQIDYALAEGFYQAAIALSHAHAEATINATNLQIIHGLVLAGLGDAESSRAVYEELIKSTSLSPAETEKLHYLLGAAYCSEEKIADAVYHLNLAPSEPRAHSLLGLIAYCSSDYAKSIACYEKAISLNADGSRMKHIAFAEVYISYANILDECGRADEAQRSLENALEIFETQIGSYNHPSMVFLYTKYSTHLHRQGKYAEALEKLKLANVVKKNLQQMYHTEINDEALCDSVLLMQQLTDLYMSLGMFSEARVQLEKIANDPNVSYKRNPNYYWSLAALEQHLGNYDAANSAYASSMRIRMLMKKKKEVNYFYCKFNIVDMAIMQGHLDEAEKLLAEMRSEYEAYETSEKFSAAIPEMKLLEASILISRSKGDLALTVFNEAYPYFASINKDPMSARALSLELMRIKAELCCDECDAFNVAKRLNVLMQQFRQVYGVNEHPKYAKILELLAKAYYLEAETDRAHEYQLQAISMLKSIYKDCVTGVHDSITSAEKTLQEYSRFAYQH